MKLIVVGLVRHGVSSSGAPTFVTTRRGDNVHLAGMWELPGGKLEGGESPTDGLARELREELGVEVAEMVPLTFSHHVYPPDKALLLLFYECVLAPGQEPAPLAAEELRLLTAAQLVDLPMPPANEPLKALLKGRA